MVTLLCLVLWVDSAKEKPITAEERSHWSFAAPTDPEIPANPRTQNPIDAFIYKSLDGRIKHAQEADRRTLIRRLSFDLIGLPPSLEEVKNFVQDSSPRAYENLVDRLLASPQFGVRQAQHWLDLARYADTDGYEFDQARPNAWRYRDWVVDALNRDLPYDRFLTLQLAGDEVDPDDPQSFIATGFNRCYPDMVDLNDQGLRRQNALNDMTETVGLVTLGLTIGCARCHDHKFDPIRQTDFYRLQAFFTPSRFRDDFAITTLEERRTFESANSKWELEQSRLQTLILELERPTRDRLAPGLPMGALDTVVSAHAKSFAERTAFETRLIFDALKGDKRLAVECLKAELGESAWDTRADLFAQLSNHEKRRPVSPPTARGIDELGQMSAPTYVLKRGEFGVKGDEVSPGFPLVLSRSKPSIRALPNSSGRRTALAEWLTQPDHPLTARVMANRVWQAHFGKGLVATASDFGTMGDAPTHPELLDWLAHNLVSNGWSLKSLHRQIVVSSTYRQATKAGPGAREFDPTNASISHQNRRRLDGESLRDALLAVSGRLEPRLGGPGVFPPLPAELTKLSSKGPAWPTSNSPTDQNRRSLYIFVRRNLRYPFFEAFDRPDTNASCPQRPVTTIAPQALSMLNSRLALDAADGLMKRGQGSDRQVELAFEIALGRPPTTDETRDAHEFLASDPSRLRDLCLAIINTNEFIYVD